MTKFLPYLQTKPGQWLVLACGLVMLYATGSWAIDTGSLWLYAAVLLLVVLIIRQFVTVAKRNGAARGKRHS